MMNNKSTQISGLEINLKEVIWDLFCQWKAILLVALFIATLVTGAKYHKDLNAYDLAIQEKKEASQSETSVDERITEILASLSEDEATTVEFLVNQNEWIEAEKEYMNNSILMNTNPVNQRTLLLDYYISMNDVTESKMTALVYGYASYLSNEHLLDSLSKVVAPNADRKFIAELISANGDNDVEQASNYNLITDSASDGAVIEIRIVLPKEADISAVERAMTSALLEHSSELNEAIGNHSISMIGASESYLFNSSAVNNRNTIMTAIYNLQNNSKNMKNAISDKQKAALESIMTLKREQQIASSGEIQKDDVLGSAELSKPGINKRYALLGFILGAFMYAFFYLLLIILGNKIRYAGDAEIFTKSRLLGEVYHKRRYNGLRALIHSRFVDKLRYKGCTDENLQIKKMAGSLKAECEHNGIKTLSIFTHSDSNEMIHKLNSLINDSGIKLDVIKVEESINEMDLLDKENTVFLIHKDDKLADLNNLLSLCNEYSLNGLGCIFLGEYAG